MTDLERFFRRIVDNLITMDPGRLHRPLTVAELTQSVVPYRLNRRSLAIETNEDYDSVILRLCAGEGDLIRMVSEEARERFRAEVASINPDLDILRDMGDAQLTLSTEALAHALGPAPDASYAPPETAAPAEDLPPEPELEPEELAAGGVEELPFDSLRLPVRPVEPSAPRVFASEPFHPAPAPVAESGARCGFCGGRLPANRTVNFCPHCGQNQVFTRCPECQSELEIGWRHCIACGHQVGE